MAGEEIYQLGGGLTLDVGERRLTRDGRAIPLAPKAFDLLVALVRQPGHLIGKQDLLQRVWSESFVEEGILAVHVSALRKALGDTARPPRYIETVPRAGYRFVASVTGKGAAHSLSAAGRSQPEVYERCARGREYLLSASMFEVPKAIDAYRAAIDLDASYAPAHAGLALAHCAEAVMRLASPPDAYRQAKSAALRALAIDAGSADAQVALGSVLFFSEWDWPGAERCLRRAIEIDPGHVHAYVVYGRLLDALGRFDEARDMKLRAVERDPLSPLVHVQMALSCWNRRQYDDAIDWAKRALDLDPGHVMAREFLVGAYMNKGDFDRYLEESIKHVEAAGASTDVLRPIEDAYRAGGWPGVARCCLQLSDTGASAFQLAVLSTLGGDLSAAFHHLDRAILAHDPSLVDLAVAPQWDRLRGDARFDGCLLRIGLPAAGASCPASAGPSK
jgi:DNA-binding winged helix-turn-helix (wHTH) protein/thioredoxin-like negative regulator of GroEL